VCVGGRLAGKSLTVCDHSLVRAMPERLRDELLLFMKCYADVFQQPPPRLASQSPLWSDMTSVDTIIRSGKRTGRRLLWSTTLLLPTLLSDSQVSISLVIHGL